ncbi:unnamed protein product [Ambrosiozyma monospora]|uniref:Unnamed protein product n=1 Tax=Ambrosiozyma monospora TaxID=43982 RepID=A0ACB5TXX2_AMBMO|nr:unnamed protein product [Ambrosiozyma monospora]
MKLQSFFLFGLISLTAVNAIPAPQYNNTEELAYVQARISVYENALKTGKNLKAFDTGKFYGKRLRELYKERKYWEEQIYLEQQQQQKQQKRDVVSDSSSYANGTLPDGYPVAGIIVYASEEDTANPDATPIAIIQEDFDDFKDEQEDSE